MHPHYCLPTLLAVAEITGLFRLLVSLLFHKILRKVMLNSEVLLFSSRECQCCIIFKCLVFLSMPF